MLIKNWYQKIENRVLLERHASVLRSNGVFDEEYYRANNQDVVQQGTDPIRHFLQNGCDEGRKPCACFSPRSYMALNHDVACSGVNPLVHYALFGQDEKRLIPVLDTAKMFVPDQSGSTLLFISHNAHRGGAQKLLLDYLRWLQQNTRHDLKLICLDGGYFMDRFEQVADVLIYNDVTALYQDEDRVRKILQEFAGENVALIYGNSLASGALYAMLKSIYDVPLITHAHELEKTIRNLLDEDAVRGAVEHSTHFVACSKAVAQDLHEVCQIDPRSISLVYEYIPAAFNPAPSWDRAALREALGLKPTDHLVVGCGNVHWRKGPDLFIQVAERVIDAMGDTVQFVWIGDFRSGMPPDFGDWKKLVDTKLKEQVSFIGGHDNPRVILAAADVFLLPSREDPFPVACLEAAACGVPSVCFEGAGGMPEFVEDVRGRVVPYEDVDTMATACLGLLNDDVLRDRMGNAAYRTIVAEYTDSQACPKLLHISQRVAPLEPEVSVIIPSYNYGRFLRQRIDSVLNQSFQNFELILLDDASTDDSWDIISAYEDLPHVRTVRNDQNSGGVFGQWQKGISMARADIIWVAEADDFCRNDFLEGLLPFFDDPEVRLAYSISVSVNDDGIPVENSDYQKYVEEFSTTRWLEDYVADADVEMLAGLAIRNTIPNASAVLFRKPESMNLLQELPSFAMCGDWYFYVNLICGGKMAFKSKNLNFHRLHQASVVAKTARTMPYFEDVLKIYTTILKNYDLDDEIRQRMISQLEKEWEWLMKDQPIDSLKTHPLHKCLEQGSMG